MFALHMAEVSTSLHNGLVLSGKFLWHEGADFNFKYFNNAIFVLRAKDT